MDALQRQSTSGAQSARIDFRLFCELDFLQVAVSEASQKSSWLDELRAAGAPDTALGDIVADRHRFAFCAGRNYAYFATCFSMKSAMMWAASMDSGKDASYQKA